MRQTSARMCDVCQRERASRRCIVLVVDGLADNPTLLKPLGRTNVHFCKTCDVVSVEIRFNSTDGITPVARVISRFKT